MQVDVSKMEKKTKRPGIRIKFKLRTKFLIGIILLECFIMSVTIFVVEHQMRNSILDEFVKRGVSIAKNLAALSTNYVSTYNYVKIEQIVGQVASQNSLDYALVQFFDGEMAAYQGKMQIKDGILNNVLNEKALAAENTLIQYKTLKDSKYRTCDIAVPIFLKEQKWATVRIGMSLSEIDRAVNNTRMMLFFWGLIILGISCLIAKLGANKITKPVGRLVESVESITAGNFNHSIDIETNDEIGLLGDRFSYMQGAVKENIELLKKSNNELVVHNRRLESLLMASRDMNSLKNYDNHYNMVLKAAMKATDTDAGTFVIINETGDSEMVASQNRNLEPLAFDLAIKMNQIQQSDHVKNLGKVDSKDQTPMTIIENVMTDSKGNPLPTEARSRLEMISIPLNISDKVRAFINLTKSGEFRSSERQILSVIGSQASTALDNKNLFAQLDQAYLSSIKTLVKSLEFKDAYTHGHSERVAEISTKIGKRLGIDDSSLKTLQNAALLHDIGKIGVVENILNKTSKLENDEWEAIKKHPTIGDEILEPTLSLNKERSIIRHHHEREDGRGYPDGLSGEQLTISEKIIIVADAFDAMNSKRAYRKQLTLDAIKSELIKNSGTHFNSDIVKAFLEIIDEEMIDEPRTCTSSLNAIPFEHDDATLSISMEGISNDANGYPNRS